MHLLTSVPSPDVLQRAGMASRRITQETFDAAVHENMEEFEMSPEEAMREAVEQFESQGGWHGLAVAPRASTL
jgi:hypothetical protein